MSKAITRSYRAVATALIASASLLAGRVVSAQMMPVSRDTMTAVDSSLTLAISAAQCLSPAATQAEPPLIIVNDSIVRPGSFTLAPCSSSPQSERLLHMEFVRPKPAEQMYGPAARTGALSIWLSRKRTSDR